MRNKTSKGKWYMIVNWHDNRRLYPTGFSDKESAIMQAEDLAREQPGSYWTVMESVARVSTSIPVIPTPVVGVEEY